MYSDVCNSDDDSHLKALGAGAVPPAFQASAVKALTESVASHDYHLTVGSVGQKWLFRELTAAGAHDTALKVGLQATYPSFGYWLANGATTCWENWSGVCDLSHPGSPWPGQPGKYLSPNPPTHNHIFLCGGVGEWLYRSLGGIAPATAGYGVVTIAPAISQTEGKGHDFDKRRTGGLGEGALRHIRYVLLLHMC